MRALLAVATLVLASGCGGIDVKSSASSNANLQQYRTYGFFPRPAAPGQVISLAEQDVRASLEKNLLAKGFKPVQGEQAPDLFVAYYTKLRDVPSLDWGYGGADFAEPMPVTPAADVATVDDLREVLGV